MVIGVKIDCGGVLSKYEEHHTLIEWNCESIPRKNEYIILNGMVDREVRDYFGEDRMNAYGEIIAVEWVQDFESFIIFPIITIDLTDI